MSFEEDCKTVSENAKIERTFLGREDHGIFTLIITLDYGGSGQGFGLTSLDTYNEKKERREGTAYGMELIMRICEVIGVKSWEELKGKSVRAKSSSGYISAIGHYLKDNWVDLQELYGEYGD